MRPRLPFGNNNKNTPIDVNDSNDPTEWLIQSGMAEFLLLHTLPIKYMIMFGYTYMAGTYRSYQHISLFVSFECICVTV